MKWRTGVCPHCETEYGTYSEDEMDYGEHECGDLRIENLENERERLLGCMHSYNQELCEAWTKIEELEKELSCFKSAYYALEQENNSLRDARRADEDKR